jgi:lipopolysaccharide export system permease protein
VKKLDQYLIREMIIPFLIGTVTVVLMFQANTYIFLAKTLNLDNVPRKAVFQYIYFQTPMYLNMTLAVGMSLGSSLAFSRIARESELTAMRAAGVRILRAIAPVMCFGILVAIGNFYLAERVMPEMTKRANALAYQIGVLAMTPDLKANAVISLENFTAAFGVVRKKGEDELDFDDVWLFDHPTLGQEHVYYAKGGHYKAGLWTFHDTYVRMFDGLNVTVSKATRMTINQRILTDSLFAPPISEESTAPELLQKIELAHRNHIDAKPTEVKYLERFSVPAACIVFALVGPVFSIIFARGGGFFGVLLSIIMVLLYYNAFVISSEILSKVDAVPAWLAAWLPNILFAFVGVVAIRRLE